MTAPYLKPPTVWRDNPQWKADTPAGVLDITINLAKPEKDPRAIAAAAQQDDGKTSSACDLCWELLDADTARLVRSGDPARVVRLGDEPWAWWYSPYGYFPEHLIAAAPEHRPMVIEPATVERLLDFVDAYPAYFIGSNADLPIVGGSLLSHDHFQGGRYRFPLMDAPVERAVSLPGAASVQAGVVRWPSSVLRLRSADRGALSRAAAPVIRTWRGYDDPAGAIQAFSGSMPHNTLNPIVWREGDDYVLDLVLRNNRTTPERPYGLFHPDESLFHIKKENIGLIEIMGRAILPARLAKELPGVKDEASQGFYQVLCATGVFKRDEAGRAGWGRFLTALGAKS